MLFCAGQFGLAQNEMEGEEEGGKGGEGGGEEGKRGKEGEGKYLYHFHHKTL